MVVDLVIKNAKIVLPERGVIEGGIAIESGIISEISKDKLLPKGDEVIDAKDNYLLPGIIDCHVHLREPGASSKEDWKTGTMAAAAGGITTVLDMPNTQPPTSTIEALEKKIEIAKSKAIVDFGFHFAATQNNEEEIRKLARNVASVKFYMSSTIGSLILDNEATIFEYFKILMEKDLIATIHAENQRMIDYYMEMYKDKISEDIIEYCNARADICSSEALVSILHLARYSGNRVHICHLSTKKEIETLREFYANVKERKVTSETAPHYLFLTKEDMRRLKGYGKVTPPLRSEKDRVELWKALKEGTIDIIATDHAPHLRENKEMNILEASAGMPGLETMLPLLLNEVNSGNLSLVDVVKLTSENPAKVFRIERKGKIEYGYDADLVIVDLNLEKKVKEDELKTKCGWSPFAGWKLKGWPIKTFVRGNLVYEDGEVYKNNGKPVKFY